jgi:hypothetical protein
VNLPIIAVKARAFGNHFLQCDLMRRMFERLLLQPAQITHRPSFFAEKMRACLSVKALTR